MQFKVKGVKMLKFFFGSNSATKVLIYFKLRPNVLIVGGIWLHTYNGWMSI